MKIVIVAPVHIYNDIRVFKKEAQSLAKIAKEVVLFARTPDNTIIHHNNIKVRPCIYHNRFHRFVSLIPLFLKVLHENADVYHLHNPDTIPIALGLKLFGKKVVYDTHEDFSQKIIRRTWVPLGLKHALAFTINLLEIIVAQIVDSFVVTQDAQANKYKNSVVIGNPPYLSALSMPHTKSRSDKIIRLIYIGGISRDRGLDLMIELTNKLSSIQQTRLTLIGPSVNDNYLDMMSASPDFDVIEYLGELPQQEAFSYFENADFGLIQLHDVADYRNTSPNKIYEYMMHGVPFIATGFKGWRDQLEKVHAGVFLDENEITDETLENIISIKNNPEEYTQISENGRLFIKKSFNWIAVAEPVLFKTYSDIVGYSLGKIEDIS